MIDSTARQQLPVAAWLIALVVAMAAPPAQGAGGGVSAVDTPGGGTPVMLDARVVGDHQRVRFVADLSETVVAGVFTLADPYRIVVDLPEVRFALPELIGRTGRGLVSAFRYGLFSAGKSRIVIDLTVPVRIEKTFVTEPGQGQPARLVIDVVPTTRQAFLDAARAYRESQGIAAAEKADRSLATTAREGRGRPTVVLDPGHGGIDSGARGKRGTLEKTVTLAISKILADHLERTGRYDVFLTRTDDSFVALGERVAFARRHNADLFVSIHANSFRGGAIRGATVYTVSEEASDKMAEEMAASENRSDILAGIDIEGEDSGEVTDILLDLTRRETRNFGMVFARDLVEELGKAITMFKIPHQQGSFKVLEAPDAPSVLLELGYLSNAGDEKSLISAEWQEATAASVIRAITAYFETRVAGRGRQ